jgi:cysteine sulfinate desulfinase/cysteine desulfurase-like protein
MGIPPELAHGSVRFSLSKDSTADEIERAAAIVGECVGVLSKSG